MLPNSSDGGSRCMKQCWSLAEALPLAAAALPVVSISIDAVFGNQLCEASNSKSPEHAAGIVTWLGYTIPWLLMFLTFLYRRGVSMAKDKSSNSKALQMLAKSRRWVMRQFLRYMCLLLFPLAYMLILLIVAPTRVCLTPGLRLVIISAEVVLASECALRLAVLPLLRYNSMDTHETYSEVQSALIVLPALFLVGLGVPGVLWPLGSSPYMKVVLVACTCMCIPVLALAVTIFVIVWALPGHVVLGQYVLHPRVVAATAPLRLTVKIPRASGSLHEVLRQEVGIAV